jgi:hypothetical protein
MTWKQNFEHYWPQILIHLVATVAVFIAAMMFGSMQFDEAVDAIRHLSRRARIPRRNNDEPHP